MAHEIFGDRFFGNRTPAWHGLGTVFTGRKTAIEAIEEGGLDYLVEKCPILIRSQWGEVPTGQVALVRQPVADDPEPRQFAVVSKDYGLLQNRQLAEMFNDISLEWPVETAGALGRGERIFLTLQVGDAEVGGDRCQQFFLLTEAKDGSGGISIKYTNVRVVCNNTLQMALGDSFEAVKLQHTTDVAERLSFERDLMVALKRAQGEKLETLQSLAECAITTGQAEEVFEAAIPNPTKPVPFRFVNVTPDAVGNTLYMREFKRAEDAKKRWDQEVSRRSEFRAAHKELYVKLGDEFPQAAGTLWHALNAVTELADHRAGASTDPESGNFEKSETARKASALFGYRAMEKAGAMAKCLEILKAGGAASSSKATTRSRGRKVTAAAV